MIELISDLGGGKTTFVQGLVAGLGYNDAVTSPTFTLSNTYQLADGRRIAHYDLYRLSEGGVLVDELAEDLADTKTITLIEWGGLAADRLPADRLQIHINVTGDTERQLTYAAGGERSTAIIKGLAA